MADIQVTDIGPVVEFEYSFSFPGLHILRGRNGAGKTTILRTVKMAVDGKVDQRPSRRDGTKAGHAQVAGRRLKLMKQVREEGDVLLDGLGELDIAELHAPKFKTATTRDNHRIKTLVRLCGVETKAELFHHLLGDEETFDKIVPADSMETDDMVEMAARVKRAIEKRAIAVEDSVKTEKANARAQEEMAEGVDLEVESDDEKLQAQLQAAIEHQATQRQRRKAADDAKYQADAARHRLTQLGDARETAELEQQVSDARDEVEATQAKEAAALDELKAAEAALARAQAKHASASAACFRAHEELASRERMLESASETIAARRALEETIATAEANSSGPSDEELSSAADAIAEARAAVAAGASARQAQGCLAKSKEHMEKAKRLEERAIRLRGAAADTAQVLTDAIATIDGCPLRVHVDDAGDPRLVLETDRSDREPFDELSDGERWSVILQIAAAKNRLIVLPQAAYGELSPSSRKRLDELAKRYECYILTAIADDCDLHGEAFGS